MPRSAVVASISALDTYVHTVVYDRVPHLLAGPVASIPEPLCELLSGVLTIRNAATFRENAALLTAPDTSAQLVERLKDRNLRFQSFQAPEKIIEAYKVIGHDAIFQKVSDLWPGPNTTADHIRNRLSGYVRRRNQIAHEGDAETNGHPRPMQPEYAAGCRLFVESLVPKLHQVVYGP